MIVKKPTRTIEFTAQDEDFIRRLSGDIGCYYGKANERTYILNKCNSDIQSEMGVFAWVHKEAKDYFWVATRKVWVEAAKTQALDGEKASGITCFARDDDQDGDSVCLDAKKDYQKTVSALILINKIR